MSLVQLVELTWIHKGPSRVPRAHVFAMNVPSEEVDATLQQVFQRETPVSSVYEWGVEITRAYHDGLLLWLEDGQSLIRHPDCVRMYWRAPSAPTPSEAPEGVPHVA